MADDSLTVPGGGARNVSWVLVAVFAILTAGCHYSFAVADKDADLGDSGGDAGPGECGDGVCSPGNETVTSCPNDCAWTQVSSGASFTCAVKQDGTVWCWGLGTYGALGNGTQDDQLIPTKVVGLTGIASVSAGTTHACAVEAQNGSLWCWGDNTSGQLGDGTTVQSQLPKKVEGLPPIREVSAGLGMTCAVDWDQSLWCWGSNTSGELGLGYVSDATSPYVVEPTLVPSMSDVSHVSASLGMPNVCAVSQGLTWCWGMGTDGQLGNGANTDSATPVQVMKDSPPHGSLTAEWVSAGTSFACAGQDLVGPSMYCWGTNQSGLLGIGSDVDSTNMAAVIEEPDDVDAVNAGITHACAHRLNGLVACWGDNSLGALGLGSNDPPYSNVPVDVPNLEDVVQVAVGALHTCVLTSTGALKCWGDNSTGELGDGTQIYRYEPADVLDP